ncbi:flagellar export chaperone FliS [Jeotgalibacillus proteolyticus]|uniref:Flagellar secretion chaperone FliS n=1 Tax=Jeotgalibacillus proteolyticus TaxID=2082395 RepID=A0A2S5GB98_9BACL|nr:flagellar export chaperone FliS [Jeotgalibacillus proteolyticus]PPA70238.1 flagellar protein FliS [Jeotgalibacillus proteolyticus]
MAVNNPYAAYQQNSVTTKSPGELTLMLYNGCIKFINQAKLAIEDENIEKRNESIQKAQKIVQEFMVTLNMDIAVSENLLAIYDYVNRRLMEANINNDPVILDEAEGMMTELRDTWKTVIHTQRQKQFGAGNHA